MENREMRILLACEESGAVRREFRKLGHDAWSCDIIPSSDDSPFHIQRDVLEVINENWDMMIAFPPCTHLAVSGARYFHLKLERQARALEFVKTLLGANIKRIALENPISIISSRIRKPDQIIQPWMFGHTEQKSTCLWLKNLPKLTPTNDVKEEMLKLPVKDRCKVWYASPGEDRAKNRSKTYEGIARAMAEQWGGLE